MPTYKVTDPDTGKTLKLTGDSPPKADELERIFSQYAPKEERLETTLPAPVAELAGAINRSITSLPRMGMEAVDYATGKIGGAPEKAWQAISEPLRMGIEASGSKNFMDPGIARDVIQVGGEYIPGVAGIAAGGRKLASDVAQELIESPRTAVLGGQIRTGESAAVGKKLTSSGQLVPDKAAADAMKQGFDEGVVAGIKASSGKTRERMRMMVEKLEKGLANRLYQTRNRPSDVVGESIQNRVTKVYEVNRQAGKRLNREASALQGQKADFVEAKTAFLDDLEKMGVTVGDDLSLSFKGSDIEDIAGSERIIKALLRRLDSIGDDALQGHRLKRFIDENVTFGKLTEGLSGKAEVVAKGLRRNIDQALDSRFPGYKDANDVYSETIRALDEIQSAAGSKIDLMGANAEKAAGTLARGLLSNNRGRQELMNALDVLEEVSGKYGLQGGDDIHAMVMLADELDKVFKPVAKSSLAGDVAKTAATEGKSGVVRDLAGKGVEAVRGVNQENALQAIKDLLASP